MKEFAALRAKTFTYLTENNNQDKKVKGTKQCVIKLKVKFEGYKNCLESTQPETKKNQLKKNKVNADSLRENHKEFMKNTN